METPLSCRKSCEAASLLARRAIALDGLARLEHGAGIALVFFGDALSDRLAALKARAGIEADAVLAGVQITVALGTLLIDGDAADFDVDHLAAEIAARHFAEGRQLWRANVISLRSRARSM